ncbi:hypothetical protein [Paenibacillus daejeonensis]|uniref:hypothetical protein n=1 Tax=Paenibacillus daejeonensis TaxID=135193 RepID=UPI0003A16D60|nr:hypothetical protein [Paenibacillus daejeonensis]
MAFILTALLITACSSTDKEFEELVTQAEGHYQAKELQSSWDVYTKALDVKEDSEIRNKRSKVGEEIEFIKKFNGIINGMKSDAVAIETSMSKDSLRTAIGELDKRVVSLKNFETSPGYRIQRDIRSAVSRAAFAALEVRVITLELYMLKKDFNVYTYGQETIQSINDFLADLEYPKEYDNIK